MRSVWILDNYNGEYEVFEDLADARKAAEASIRKQKKAIKEETNEILKEINESYNEDLDEILKEIDESYDEESGFQSNGVFYCWQIPYHAKEEN